MRICRPQSTRRLARATLLFAALGVGCGASSEAAGDATPNDASTDGSGADEAALIDHQSWQRYDRSLDPLVAEQPTELECGIAGFFVERGELEIDSARCNYLLAEHPALLPVRRGQRLTLEFRHYDLAADEPAETHIAILFGNQRQWETRIAIPSAANTIHAEFVATEDLAVGGPIRLHLHNHGQNTYTFAWLRVRD
jgi:hypothetical protein